MALYAQRRYGDAVERFQQAFELAPERPEYSFHLGESKRSSGDLDGARKAYEETIRLERGHVQAHYYRGILLVYSNRSDSAATSFRRVLKLDPEHVSAHLGLGKVYTEQGRYQEAIEILQQGANLEPRNTSIHFTLSQAYLKAGQLGKERPL